jgi:hypothetical protein
MGLQNSPNGDMMETLMKYRLDIQTNTLWLFNIAMENGP